MTRPWSLLILVALLLPSAAAAHEARPAYLQIEETQPGQYEVLWKRPQRGDLTLGLHIVWPDICYDVAPGASHTVPGALIERRLFACGASGLIGERITIEGLASTLTDVLVRIEFLDGRVQTNLIKPGSPWMDVEGRRPFMAIAADYFTMGVQHILFGIDHLLFVLGLMLIVGSTGVLVKTITAFTVAHSLTLALAALGFVHIPQAPVEAMIALSILFLARELARKHRGEIGLAARYPWLIAFSFGLLHGFGFAGALAEIGLPQTDIPLALLMFNLGVEAGQLLFIGAVLALLWLGGRYVSSAPRLVQHTPAYAIGSLATFWLIERISAFG